MVRTRAVAAVVYTGDDGCCDGRRGGGCISRGGYTCSTYIYIYMSRRVCASEEMVVE